MPTPTVPINHHIRAREVPLIDTDGTQNVVPLARALEIANQRSLDLVEVAATAVPPVCRIMDYGKYRYTQRKKAAESKKKATRVVVKEVKLGSQTDEHDVNFKVNHIRRFLDEGMRVKVSVFFRGRAITHPEKGKEMLDLVMTKIEDVATSELFDAATEGRVGVEDVIADPQERADARHLLTALVLRPRSTRPRGAGLGEFGLGAEVQHGAPPVVEGDVEVVVEVAAERRVPPRGS